MTGKKKKYKIVCSFFLIFSFFTVLASEETPHSVLAQARILTDPFAASQLLEQNLNRAGELRPWFLLDLARYTAESGNWKKSLEWSQSLSQIEVPKEIADDAVWWLGEGLVHADRKSDAATLYRRYIETGSVTDPRIYLAYFRIASTGAESISARFDAAFPVLAKTDPRTFALSRYLAGLCAVRSGEWAFAARSFARFSPAMNKLVPEYAAWSQYYLAYSLYRLGKWSESTRAFSTYLDTWPHHDFSWQAATTAALAAIQAEENPLPFTEKAVRLAPTNSDLADSLLLKASILLDRKQYTDAEAVLSGLADGTATGGLTTSAPRALFMLGESAARQKKTELASEYWLSVVDRFPKNALADDALFRAGEQWYIADDWNQSFDLFSRYRRTFPSGNQLESVLRDGGDAAERGGNNDLAILWWEELLKKYPNSSFVPRTYSDLITAYRKKQDYRSALRTAEAYEKRFPDEAAVDGIGSEKAELISLANGENANIATLEAAYAKANRSKTGEGRETGFRLAKSYMENYSRRTDAYTILREITAELPHRTDTLSARDRSVFASAWSLLGSMLREDADYRSASSAFLNAGNLYAKIDGERSAEALYGAADCFLQAGLRADAVKTTETLKKTWPDSLWTRRAELLILE